MKFIMSCCYALAVLAASAGTIEFDNGFLVGIDYKERVLEPENITPRATIVTNEPWASFFEMKKKVDALWTAHTNRIASIKRHKERQAKQAALQKVRENVKKHKSAMGKSSGGVK